MTKKYLLSAVLACGVLAFGFGSSSANASASGTNADNITVTVKANQGDKWITARKQHTDNDGVLELKNVLPGKYIFKIDSDDQTTGQTLGVKLRMLDENGRRIKEKVDIKSYIFIGDAKIYLATYTTDKSGWIEMSGLTHGTTYELEVTDTVHLKKKDNRPRVKVKAKVDGSKWFDAAYGRLDENGVLTLSDVISAKYKFKYKSSDNVDPRKPFTLQLRLRHDNGRKIKKPTKVKLYAYVMGVRQHIATLKTDRKGNITLPGIQVGVKYKIKVSDRK